jgi:hypothetical protein
MAGFYQNDVIGVPISGNPINNGSIVTNVQKGGTYQKVDPKVNKVSEPTDVFSKYDIRLDDPKYYY